MLVNGFLGYAKVSSDSAYSYCTTELIISCSRYTVKATHKMGVERESAAIDYKARFSIFYAYEVSISDQYEGDKINLLTQRLTEALKRYQNDTIKVSVESSNFTSINIDNQDKKIIRTLTYFNFSLASSHKLHLNPLYSNSKIVRVDLKLDDLTEHYGIIKSWGSSLTLKLLKFYNDGYTRIRAIVPHFEFDKIEVFSNSYSSFYVKYDLNQEIQEIAIKYSIRFPWEWRDIVLDAIHMHLSRLANSEDLNGEDILKEISIDENFITSPDLRQSRYNLIIDIYNAHDLKSYVHNLFVVCISNNRSIFTALDKSNRIHWISTLQIILPQNKAKEYKLLQDKNFRDRVHAKKTIEQIIRNNVVIFRTYPAYTLCIIPKE